MSVQTLLKQSADNRLGGSAYMCTFRMIVQFSGAARSSLGDDQFR